MMKYFGDINLPYNYTDIMGCFTYEDSFENWVYYIENQIQKLNYQYSAAKLSAIKIQFNSMMGEYLTFKIYYDVFDKNYITEYRYMKQEIENMIRNFNSQIYNLHNSNVPNGYLMYNNNKFYIELADGQQNLTVDYIRFKLLPLEENAFEYFFSDYWEDVIMS